MSVEGIKVLTNCETFPLMKFSEMRIGKEYDEKSDVWALGCVLGEMCCRMKTFSASNISDLITRIMKVKL